MEIEKIKRCELLLKSRGFSEWSYRPPLHRILYKLTNIYLPPPYVLSFVNNFVIFLFFGWVLSVVSTALVNVFLTGFSASVIISSIFFPPILASLFASLYSGYIRVKRNLPLWPEI